MATLTPDLPALGRLVAEGPGRTEAAGAPPGAEALALAALAEAGRDVVLVARDDVVAARVADELAFAA
ncbi:MAG: hypothetical protein VW405_07310, partial [Rhodospirillaceae bacterium]